MKKYKPKRRKIYSTVQMFLNRHKNVAGIFELIFWLIYLVIGFGFMGTVFVVLGGDFITGGALGAFLVVVTQRNLAQLRYGNGDEEDGQE